MPPELVNGAIAAFVALLTSGVTGYFAWSAIQRERTKWVTELKSSFTVERYKARLEAYPAISQLVGQVSGKRIEPLTPGSSQQIGHDINGWFYSLGGLISDQSTRGAVLGLRDACLRWKEGPMPPEVWEWRDAALFCLRRDLDLVGLSEFDPADTAPLLEKLTEEMNSVTA